MINLLRVMCWFGKHSIKKRVRHHAPAIGREELYCIRCGDSSLIPLIQPRSRERLG